MYWWIIWNLQKTLFRHNHLLITVTVISVTSLNDTKHSKKFTYLPSVSLPSLRYFPLLQARADYLLFISGMTKYIKRPQSTTIMMPIMILFQKQLSFAFWQVHAALQAWLRIIIVTPNGYVCEAHQGILSVPGIAGYEWVPARIGRFYKYKIFFS